MSLSFRDLAPAAETWLQGFAQAPLLKQAIETAWVFAVVEAGHLLFLAVLGGAVLVLNLRLLDLVLVSEPAEVVELRTRPWLNAGVAGTITTGVLMGLMNASSLFSSVAFFVKMVALVAAILFSYAVVREVSRETSSPSRSARLAAVLALLIWGFALVIFAATPGVNPGVLLVVLAGAALLAVAVRRRRTVLLLGLVLLLGGGWAVTHLILPPLLGPQSSSWTGSVFAAAAGLFAAAVGALELRADGPRYASAKLAAFASTLVWVTVAAAGRWIGFS